ncbi:hypothetical protein GGI20_000530 [Coemansia sp. BCRC 34301]|nr:hypothetical protein GGI20_000530 [Coemansia sp. BCRC 34301]
MMHVETPTTKTAQQLPLRRPKPMQVYPNQYAVIAYQNSLPTPTDDYATEEEHYRLLSCPGSDHASKPSDAYSQMAMADKVREANYALVHSWGKFLVGSVIRELGDTTSFMHTTRLVSLIDIPADFCISPVDEPLGPSSDPTRVIVIVSPSGLIVDTGIFDSDGPVFYKGCVVCNNYVSAALVTN